MDKGYVHLYTGDGKGKTTAAFGLALRAAMSGKKVYIGQFVKDMEYNETKIKDIVDNIDIEQLGRGCFIFEDPAEEDKEAAREGLRKCTDVLKSGEYDMVILDELTIALYFKLFDVEDIIEAIRNRDEKVEVVITGRYAPKELYDLADLVTEMKEVKHYYSTKGLLARDGIER
ncbi:cob(I)yrinic acid a,c-diamide adenosyltransferase [Dethiosulfatibacter aminovorans DSM 17477]|uniref:Cob(I)yrinic acid a,c-diamide adenosyltransferase n=1 Tax=Dethiosulfatibacter aminovorans DSM 17477 TaxID=1121476 RepID=A0A1M6GRF3_9FIRM|nr:cob(I)yrinic acid a,c-diamide adenosyltransferase [Dethiosulfatibacter aminovorans]SHJ12480.1 cob(I)yrinic acid a,c-diamide adenosyltransferase [Dethiosulfatibacter aminovorans DSM 17477]